MTITIPHWPFVVLAWSILFLAFASMAFFGVLMLVRVFKSKNLFRMASIYLTCEKWRKEANVEVYEVLEDCMRAMAKDQPDCFHCMRERLLLLHRQPVNHEALRDELLRAEHMASEVGLMPLAQKLAAMVSEVRQEADNSQR